MSETETATEAPKRGRPRPQDAVERDEKVYTFVTDEPVTVRDIVAESGLERSHVYLSLIRLREQRRVDRVKNDSTGATTRFWQRTG